MRIGHAGLVSVVCLMGAFAPALAAENEQSWRSEHFRDHPLVGKIYAVGRKAFVPETQILAKAAEVEFVLLGETHTNADHHLLQARVVAAMVQAGSRPSVYFEMIPKELAGALADYLGDGGASAAGLGAAVSWEKRGWPDWEIYQPIAEVALANGLALRVGDIDSALRKRIGKEGLDALSAEENTRLALDRPFNEPLRDSLSETLRVSHCGMLPEAAVGAILKVQRARDAALADAMLSADEEGAVLIAGRGHARADYAVPWYLRARRADARILTVGFVEVEPDETDPADYLDDEAADVAAFDYLWFTPKNDISDQCADLRKRFGKPDDAAKPETSQ